jgi:hypothetical protein
VLLALLLGVGLGLAYAWVLFPHPDTDAPPRVLRAEFKDQYRSLIAAAYAATGNLPRAQARLSVLDDADLMDALNAQAQRMLANPQTFERPEQLVTLASALEVPVSGASVPTQTLEIPVDAGNTFTPTLPLSLTDIGIILSETPELMETQTTVAGTPLATRESIPRPTHTLTPTPGQPFTLTAQETLCDSNLPEGLLQVMVLNRSRRQLAGVEVVITWDGGMEQFFTGLKPELGNGYTDYLMTPDITYTVQLARGSDVALGVAAPTCQSPDGATFLGGIKLTFQQP